MKTLGVIGFGNFSKFLLPFLSDYLDVVVYKKNLNDESVLNAGFKTGTLDDVCKCDYLMLSVPVQFLEKVVLDIKDKVSDKTLVFDVSSVKVKPVEYMKKHLPKNIEIVGTHPLFGPQSGRFGIKGLNMVICPVRTTRYDELLDLFETKLELNVMEKTPEEHDKNMVYVHALSHFIGRALNEIDIPFSEQRTVAYEKMMEIRRNLGGDSWELFCTIENENPYAEGLREEFINKLMDIHKRLKK